MSSWRDAERWQRWRRGEDCPNTVPHLHVHIFPRSVGDPFEGRPIDPRAVREPVYGPGEFTRMRERVIEELARLSAER